MIHIDHSRLPDATPPPPEPAVPILASHLLDLEEQQRKRFTRDGRLQRLSTGCGEVDEVLGGGGAGGGAGVERGVVLGISASVEGREGKLLSLHLLASALLPQLQKQSTTKSRSSGTKATIIDTTGSFPLALLASVLKSRLSELHSLAAQNAVNSGNYAVRESNAGKDAFAVDVGSIDAQVQQCLEMVAISRVFDIEGLWEVIGEVDHVLSSPNPEMDEQHEIEQAAVEVMDGPEVAEKDFANNTPEIMDSEEDTTPPIDVPRAGPKENTPDDQADDGIEIIVVDNMTHLINELFARKEKSEAHNLLTLLSSTLHTLSKTNNILTVLHNSTNPTNTNTNTNYPHSNQNQNHRQNLNPNQNQNPTRSIFSSATQKPALGQIFAQFPDLHILLHPLTRVRTDAEALYGGGGGGGESHILDEEDQAGDFHQGSRHIRYTTVLEVLKDEARSVGGEVDRGGEGGGESEKGRKRFAYREQRWTAVDVRGDGLGIVCSFEERGGAGGNGTGSRNGMKPTSVEEGLSGGVGNVAKIWGFGGRRV